MTTFDHLLNGAFLLLVLRQILSKTQVRDRAQAVRYAYQHGSVE